MDKLILTLVLAGCAALTVYALRVSEPVQRATASAEGAAATVGLSSGDAAQHDGMDHSAHGAPSPGETASTKAFRAANDIMHRDMNIQFTGAADADFVRGMIPHHQGAIDMAKIVLEHGKDPEIRKLAEGIVAAQESEIASMRDWLAKNVK